jgi:hypothetical protein
MTTTKPEMPDINALAIEACDMWQEHLSTLANDPSARAELTRFLEPQRRLFADWAAMMQQGGKHESQRAKPNAAAPTPAAQSEGAAPRPAPPSGSTHGDDPLRVAQLALRVAELEKRLAQLESKAASAVKRTQREAS